jgi:hypothetical protein
MPSVQLRDITTDEERQAVLALRRGPGQDRYLGSALYTSCAAGYGSPQPFYLHYGFVLTGESKWGEDILRLDLRALRWTGQEPLAIG